MKKRITCTQEYAKSPEFNERKIIIDLIIDIMNDSDLEWVKKQFNIKVINPKDRAKFIPMLRNETDFDRIRQLEHLKNCNFIQYEAEF